MSMEDTKKFSHLLHTNGYRMTQARMKTFQSLMSPEPQSMGQLLKKVGDTIDRVTLYRNVELFEKLGIAHRIYIGWKYKIELSDDFIAHHHHLSCLNCSEVIHIDEKHIDDFVKDVANRFGFTPRRHQFEVDGYCKDCAQSKD